MICKSEKRHAVVMLMVLMILAFFVLVVLTYLLTTGQAEKTATASGSSGSSAHDDMRRTVNELVAGTDNVRSIFYNHSLLEDMWGHDDGTGRPYNGTDVGNAESTNVPIALQLNPRMWLVGPDYDTLSTTYTDALAGGMDEDYDAIDYRNAFLAMVDESGTVLRPSFHDPALIQYVTDKEFGGNWTNGDADVQRRISFRPVTGGSNHTGFTGSNASFQREGPFTSATAWQWDVDNNGDGEFDSVWIYNGEPARSAAAGTSVVPMYAILCIDLDGRLNVNLHSNKNITSNTGFGLGPAEVSLGGITASEASLIAARQGSDGVAGSASDPVADAAHMWMLPTGTWAKTDVNSWGGPHDLFGTGAVTLGGVGVPAYASLSSSANNPYRMNISSGVGDNEFELAEFERMLRTGDVDANTLPDRLANLVNGPARHTITTHSSDSNAAAGPFAFSGFAAIPPSLANKTERIPLNMRLGNGVDDSSPLNGVVDEEGETSKAWWATAADATAAGVTAAFGNQDLDLTTHNRTALATRMYDVAMAVTPDSSDMWADASEKEQFIAQWVVNIIDFRDRDSIMTRFEYDTGQFVFGCEAPQLLIAETACWHDRRTSDADADTTYSQLRRPQGNLVIKLNNPWGPNDATPGEFYYDHDAATPAMSADLLLDQTTPTTDKYPVWRMAVAVKTPSVATDVNPTLADADVERVLYFLPASGVPTALKDTTGNNGDIQFFITGAGNLAPGGYATIFPTDKKIYVGKRDDAIVNLNSTAYSTTGLIIDPSTVSGVKLTVDKVTLTDNRLRFSASEPLTGYEATVAENGQTLPAGDDTDDGFYAAAVAGLLDTDADVTTNTTHIGWKKLVLQRLANPLADYDGDNTSATYNPYITVDSQDLDLTAFSGEQAGPAEYTGTIKFETRQRSEANNIYSQTAAEPTATGTLIAPIGNNRFGEHNTAHAALVTDTPKFAWFTWNNRPYMSRLELLLVPHSAPQKLLGDHSTIDSNSPYTTQTGEFAHLPNLFYKNTTANTRPQLHRLLEYVDTRSLFAGTRQYPEPAGTLHPAYYGFGTFGGKTYTTPGRVNINTLTATTWAGILNGMSGPTYATLEASRKGFTDSQNNHPTLVDRPFRSFAGSTATANTTDVETIINNSTAPVPEIDFTLLRSNGAGTEPLFAITANTAPGDDPVNTDRNPYFRYKLLSKLGNTVTNRSHVYAVWITVGYFEAESVPASAAFPEGIKIGVEHSNAGEVSRHRAFYIIDRSRSDYTATPFLRGDDSQLDKVILMERFIE